jgi:hypothetical protein
VVKVRAGRINKWIPLAILLAASVFYACIRLAATINYYNHLSRWESFMELADWSLRRHRADDALKMYQKAFDEISRQEGSVRLRALSALGIACAYSDPSAREQAAQMAISLCKQGLTGSYSLTKTEKHQLCQTLMKCQNLRLNNIVNGENLSAIGNILDEMATLRRDSEFCSDYTSERELINSARLVAAKLRDCNDSKAKQDLIRDYCTLLRDLPGASDSIFLVPDNDDGRAYYQAILKARKYWRAADFNQAGSEFAIASAQAQRLQSPGLRAKALMGKAGAKSKLGRVKDSVKLLLEAQKEVNKTGNKVLELQIDHMLVDRLLLQNNIGGWALQRFDELVLEPQVYGTYSSTACRDAEIIYLELRTNDTLAQKAATLWKDIADRQGDIEQQIPAWAAVASTSAKNKDANTHKAAQAALAQLSAQLNGSSAIAERERISQFKRLISIAENLFKCHENELARAFYEKAMARSESLGNSPANMRNKAGLLYHFAATLNPKDEPELLQKTLVETSRLTERYGGLGETDQIWCDMLLARSYIVSNPQLAMKLTAKADSQCLRLQDKSWYQRLYPSILSLRGSAQFQLQEYLSSAQSFRKAISMLSEHDREDPKDPQGSAGLFQALGNSCAKLGANTVSPRDAAARLNLILHKECDSTPLDAFCMARIYAGSGDLTKSAELQRLLLSKLCSSKKDQVLKPIVLMSLGQDLIAKHEYDSGQRAINESLELTHTRADKKLAYRMALRMASSSLDNNDYDQAAFWLKQIPADNTQVGEAKSERLALYIQLSRLQMHKGDTNAANNSLTAALQLLEKMPDEESNKSRKARCWFYLSKVAFQQGNSRNADAALKRAETLLNSYRSSTGNAFPLRGDMMIQRGALLVSEGKYEQALDTFVRSMDFMEIHKPPAVKSLEFLDRQYQACLSHTAARIPDFAARLARLKLIRRKHEQSAVNNLAN